MTLMAEPVNLTSLINEINSKLGKSVLRLGDDSTFDIIRIPTGSLTYDRVLGGGFALGRHVELVGDENSGKSFLAYKTMVLTQQRGKLCALIDPERTFDSEWFRHLGGDPDQLIIIRPDQAEDAVEAIIELLKIPEVQVITIDSVAALLTREERDKAPTEEARIASQARFMSINLRRLTNMNANNALFIWTNQYRTNIGVSFGNPNVTSGGRALKYYDTTRLEIRRGEAVKVTGKKASKGKLVESQIQSGYWVYVKSIKEKSTRPGREGSFIFDQNRGVIDEASEIIQLGLEDGLITREGNKFTYTDSNGVVHQGLDSKFKKILRTDETVRSELIDSIQHNTIALSKPEKDKDGDNHQM